MYLTSLSVLALAGLSVGSAIEKRAACSSYTLLNTRGTGEPQGQSAGFKTMNANILKQVAGGKIHEVKKSPAERRLTDDQIVNHIRQTLTTNPNECFIVEGYSQGAAATVNALTSLTGASFNAVTGVFLIGDPEHRPGRACNVDNNGGTTTRNAIGIEVAFTSGIPANWVSKSLDVCIFGDGVCDSAHGVGITPQHLQYPGDAPTQNLGTTFAVGKLRGTS